MGKLLSAVRVLTELDMAILASYCQAYSTWAQATEKVQEQGMVFRAKTGAPLVSPYLPIVNKANEQMVRALIELGATPSSRSRVKAEPKKEESPEDAFLKSAK